jgi:tRNA-specific 2-thiouridylase
MATKPLVIVALSGGVDSAVAAALLRDAGHDVQCLHMSNWEDDGYCDAARDFQDARRVCAQLGVPLHRVSFAAEYKERVFAHFLAEYEAGRTPNPDVLCNREIKFGTLKRYAKRLGSSLLATGHYARLARMNGESRLLKGSDTNKDQSYFLHAVPGRDFDDVLFPLGDKTKAEVRAIARARRLPVADKKDSTGICFIGERPFADFLSRYLPSEPGPVKTPDGQCIGTHRGLAYYTLGQRHGLGIGGRSGGADAPWYVAAKRPEHNELIVVQGDDHPLLFQNRLRASSPRWVNGAPREWHCREPFRCSAKTRYRQPDQTCTVRLRPGGELDVHFDTAQRAVTPGQYVVLYDGDRCLGGATIEAAEHQRARPPRAVQAH